MNNDSHKRLRKSYDKELTGSPSKKTISTKNIYSYNKNFIS
jgi:hypothetical protein